MAWSKKHDQCLSCGTRDWSHRARGYCSKCYPLIRIKETAEAWDMKNPASLLPCGPVDMELLNYFIQGGMLGKVRKSIMEQVDARIHLYERYNNPGDVEPLHIELLWERIATVTNNVSQRDLFYGSASRYDSNFNRLQRQIIYKDLLWILINRRFHLDVWKDLI